MCPLCRLARKVYVIHRREQLRGQKILQRKALEEPKIEFVWNTVVKEINGEEVVKTLLLENVKEAIALYLEPDKHKVSPDAKVYKVPI